MNALRFAAAVAALAVLVTAASGPRPASAVTQTNPAPTPNPNVRTSYTYNTFVEPVQTVGTGLRGDLNQNFGSLSLTFNPGGIINGTYRPDFGNWTQLSGGMTAARQFYLTIGRQRYTGHFTRYGFVATSDLGPGGYQWRLYGRFQGTQNG